MGNRTVRYPVDTPTTTPTTTSSRRQSRRVYARNTEGGESEKSVNGKKTEKLDENKITSRKHKNTHRDTLYVSAELEQLL